MLRSAVEPMLQESQRFVRPNGTNFDNPSTGTASAQDDGSKYKFDSTAIWANQMFANGLSSYLVPKSTRWAYVKPVGVPSAELDDEQLLHLEMLSDIYYHVMALPQVQFYQTAHESFYDLGSYGTSVSYVKEKEGLPTFKSCPLADCLFDEDDSGNVDTMYYTKRLTTKAMIQAYPDIVNIDGFSDKSGITMWNLVFSVEPNKEGKKGGRLGSERPFKTTHWVQELKTTLDTGYVNYFPFIVSRWTKVSGEIYGRGPAQTCLSDIKVVNKMVKELLKSAELANAPTLSAEEDTILLPFSLGARQMIWREQGAPAPEPINSGSQPNLTQDMLQSYRDTIVKCFFVDQIIREQKKERQSILEIQDERGQMLQQLGPLLARQENEFLAPAIEITHTILEQNRKLPDVPESLVGADMEIVYTSPAAQAQYAGRIADIQGFLQDTAPLVQQKPELMDNIDDTELFNELARLRGVTRRILRSKDDVDGIRGARAENEQNQQMVGAAPELAGAIKDVAAAKATDPEGIGQLLNA